MVRAYESDADQRRDLLQDIHFALWRSFAGFAGQCTLGTWIYRLAQTPRSRHVCDGVKRVCSAWKNWPRHERPTIPKPP
jgi:hypothetical protein